MGIWTLKDWPEFNLCFDAALSLPIIKEFQKIGWKHADQTTIHITGYCVIGSILPLQQVIHLMPGAWVPLRHPFNGKTRNF